jgi:Asp-tRNA(Asn)/Glu-tRNA(Gln) amidotransferase A subunit family amidase
MAAIGQAATDLTQMSALELAEAIRFKRVSSEEVIEAYLQDSRHREVFHAMPGWGLTS